MKPLNPDEPRQVGRYRLVAALGEGGMGRVLLGVSPDGRLVAVKQVHPGFAHDDGFRSRFRREVQISRMVSGAYTAAVMDADPDAPTPWLASVFVAGPSLKEAVEAAGPLPPAAVRVLAVGLASALSDIHRAGLIHRDLKPSNVLLTDDGARVIDFGIARAAEGDSELTHTGSIIGSPGFMSPEQADGRPLTPASDVFSLGGLLAMAATGRAPFGGGSTPQVLYNVVHSRPDLGALPPELRRLIEPCLAKDPAQRPTPAQILDFLGPVQPGVTPWPPAVHALIGTQKAQVSQALALPVPGRKRRRWPLVAAAVVAVVAVAGATVAVVAANSGRKTAGSAPVTATTSPKPEPFSLADLRQIDPCKLLPPDSMPGTGRVRPADRRAGLLDQCSLSFDETADKTRSTTIDLSLFNPVSLDGVTPIRLDGHDVYFKKHDSSCDAAVKITASPNNAVTASAQRKSGDACAAPREAISVILKEISDGTAERFPAAAGSAISVDLCQDLQSPVDKPADDVKTLLHQCQWYFEGIGSYVLSLTGGTNKDLSLDGQRAVDVAGTKAYEQLDTGENKIDRCTITWTHRQVDAYYTEEFSLVFTPDPEPPQPTGICPAAEAYARTVLSQLPPVK
ncbi:serine/threonine-protein kinase [Amycolatopsis sp. NEAU-NG30]|uniref:Serine/threonine-protein kinase n=1 Tax=Amycolatopsis melonis TaxID=3156488 RepID=A0ABV0LAH1_9PSEU